MYPLENYSLRLSVIQIWYQCNALPGVVQPSRPSNGFMYYAKGEGQDFYFGDKVYHAGLGTFCTCHMARHTPTVSCRQTPSITRSTSGCSTKTEIHARCLILRMSS